MHPDWQRFLSDRGALIKDGAVRHFGDPEREIKETDRGNVIADLSHLGLLLARGADTVSFLHGQFTNDLRALGGTSQLDAYCNAQGRVLAIFRVFQRDDAVLLQLPAPLLEPMLKRLRMFVLRAKTTLEDASDNLARVGVSGPDAESMLARATGWLPTGANACETRDQVSVLRLPGTHPRFELVAPPAVLTSVWESLSDCVPVGAERWHWLDIMAGLPHVESATSETHIPQAFNLDILDGISFNKGCYPGQEIVARTRYLGRLKQRMYRASITEGGDTLNVGDAVYSALFGEQSAGSVIAATLSPDGGADLLVIAQVAAAHARDLHLRAPNGPLLSLRNLPYPLPEPGPASEK